MNEPRSGKGNGAAEIQSWVTQVAPYAKWYAPQQLITVGEDGFYQASNCQAYSCGTRAPACDPLQSGAVLAAGQPGLLPINSHNDCMCWLAACGGLEGT